MTEHPCIRCHQLLTLEQGHLLFCTNCGTPQIFLSEELQEQAALEAKQYAERGIAAAAEHGNSEVAGTLEAAGEDATPPDQRRDQRRHRRELRARQGRWPVAVEYALLSSGIALGLDFLGLLFAPVLFLAWLWIVSAPILTVGFYNARVRAGRLTAGFAARLGLLTGLLVSAGCAIVFTVSLLLARYAQHNGSIDTEIADAVAQVRANAQAQYGSAAAPMVHLLGIPEFRVGFLLWMCAVTAGLYLVVSAATAALAGLLLSRRKTA